MRRNRYTIDVPSTLAALDRPQAAQVRSGGTVTCRWDGDRFVFEDWSPESPVIVAKRRDEMVAVDMSWWNP